MQDVLLYVYRCYSWKASTGHIVTHSGLMLSLRDGLSALWILMGSESEQTVTVEVCVCYQCVRLLSDVSKPWRRASHFFLYFLVIISDRI